MIIQNNQNWCLLCSNHFKLLEKSRLFMFNKKIIAIITTIIIVGIGLTAVGSFSNLGSQSEQIKESSQSEDSQVIKITGKYAEAICKIIEISCPENVEFNGSVGINNSVEYQHASKKSIYFFKILNQQLEFMGKKFIDGEWQVVADEWTVLIKGDELPPWSDNIFFSSLVFGRKIVLIFVFKNYIIFLFRNLTMIIQP